jgi:hypothetical protein
VCDDEACDSRRDSGPEERLLVLAVALIWLMLAMRAFIKDTEMCKCKSAGKVIEDDEAESPGRVSAGADETDGLFPA